MKITSLLLTALPKAKLSPEIRSLMKTEPPETVYKLVVGVSLPLFHVSLGVNGAVYPDAFNLAEPYDRKTHVFYLPESPAGRGRRGCRPSPRTSTPPPPRRRSG